MDVIKYKDNHYIYIEDIIENEVELSENHSEKSDRYNKKNQNEKYDIKN